MFIYKTMKRKYIQKRIGRGCDNLSLSRNSSGVFLYRPSKTCQGRRDPCGGGHVPSTRRLYELMLRNRRQRSPFNVKVIDSDMGKMRDYQNKNEASENVMETCEISKLNQIRVCSPKVNVVKCVVGKAKL